MFYGHSQDLAAALPLIEAKRPAYWKAIDPPAGVARQAHELGTNLVVRHAGMDGNDWLTETGISPEATAWGFHEQCRIQPWYPYAWAVETPNEPFPVWEVSTQYIQFMSELVRLFAVDGKECIVGNFGTHQGPPPAVPGARWYGIHTYFGSHQGWSDVTSPGPYFITECGFTDALGTDVPPGRDNDYGWRGRISVDAYLGKLYWLPHLYPRCAGAFIFQFGANPDWASFECLGVPELEALIASTSTPQQKEEPVVTLGEGMKNKAAELGEVVTGRLLSGEQYLGTDVSFAVFEKGEMRYYKKANLTAFIPFV